MTTIAVDTITIQRAIAVLPLVQEQYDDATEDYVYMGAVTVGLNRLFDRNFKFKAADFATPAGADDTVEVELWGGDEDRAQSLADDLGIDVGAVLSAALCTGVAKLVGNTARIVGPFSEAV
jgi:hypothetical protein